MDMRLKPDWIRQIEDRATAVVEGYVFSCHLFDQVQVPKEVPLGMIADVITQIRKEVWTVLEVHELTSEAHSHFQYLYDKHLMNDERIEFIGDTDHVKWYRPASTLVRIGLKGDPEPGPEFTIPKYEISGDVVTKKVSYGDLLHRALFVAREYHGFDQVISVEIIQEAS